MSLHNEYQKPRDIAYLRDHLANERTFLAWIRTSIGIMAFGFVIEKFSLFLKEIAGTMGLSHLHIAEKYSSSILRGYSSVFGIVLIAMGALLCVLSYFKYKHIEMQIEENSYRASILLDIMLALSICLIGVILVLILIA